LNEATTSENMAGLKSAVRRNAQQSTELANFPSDSFDIPDLHESGFLRTDKRGGRTDGLFESDLLCEILILKLQL
jgi:hypothetical protein